MLFEEISLWKIKEKQEHDISEYDLCKGSENTRMYYLSHMFQVCFCIHSNKDSL